MSHRAIGVDLGGTNLRAALVELGDDQATLIAQMRREVGAARGPEDVASAVVSLVNELARGEDLRVGVGVAAMLHGLDGHVVNAPNLGWRDVPFGKILGRMLGRPVWLDNDLNAIAWGEHRFGAARGSGHMLCVFVGTGVGGAAVLGGVPLRGASNVAMEIGHVKVQPGGRRCGCGQDGCLEAYAGGAQLAAMTRDLGSEALLKLVDGDVERLHGGHLDRVAREGCEQSRGIIARSGGFLGQVLANASTLFNPDCLLLGGTVWDGSPLLREYASDALRSLIPLAAKDSLSLVSAALGEDAGVIGAADLGRRELGSSVR